MNRFIGIRAELCTSEELWIMDGAHVQTVLGFKPGTGFSTQQFH